MTKNAYGDFSDEELCQRIQNAGDAAAFVELQERHSSRVRSVCKKEFEAGKSGIHKKMAINYVHLVDDVSMIVWQNLYKKILMGVRFDGESSFVKLLTRVARNKTKDLKRRSVRNRKNCSIKGGSNIFQSKDQEEAHNNIPALSDSSQTDENDSDKEQIIELLSQQLDAKEQLVFQLMKDRFERNEKLNQEDMASKLGISDRTVRNRIKSIREKAEQLRREI